MEKIIDNNNGTYSFQRDGQILHTGKWGDKYVAPKISKPLEKGLPIATATKFNLFDAGTLNTSTTMGNVSNTSQGANKLGIGPIAPKPAFQIPALPNFAEQTTQKFIQGLSKSNPSPTTGFNLISQANASDLGKISVDDFANKIKAKYPEYKDIDNSVLTEKIVAKYPEYKDTIDFGTPAKEQETGGFMEDVKTSMYERLKQSQESQQREQLGQQTGFETGLQSIGQGLGLLGDIGMAGISNITPDFVKAGAKNAVLNSPFIYPYTLAEKLSPGLVTKPLVKGIEGVSKVAEQYPRATANIGAGINIATSIPGIGIAGKGLVKGGVGATKLATAPIGYTGKGLKKAGEVLYKTAIKPNTEEAKLLLKSKAGLGTTPITIADTALKAGIAGTETRIGVQALKEADKIFKAKIAPELEKSKEVHNIDDIFNKAEAEILAGEGGVLKKQELLNGLNALKEDYASIGKKQFTTKDLQLEKSSLDEFTPNKIFKGQDVANGYNQVKNTIANIMRQTVRDDLAKTGLPNAKELYRDYANLQELSKIGIKGLTDAGYKGGFGGFWTTLYEQATTPIKTIGGQVLYKVGDKLEFIGPKGINKLGDYIKGKVNITKDGVLNTNISKNVNNPINSTIKTISGDNKSILKTPLKTPEKAKTTSKAVTRKGFFISPPEMILQGGEWIANKAFKLAKKLAGEGKTDDEIFKTTGLFRGVDGKWRQELDTSKMKVILTKANNDLINGEGYYTKRLKDVISSNSLFEQYPEFKDMQVNFSPNKDLYRADYSPLHNEITVSSKLLNDKGYINTNYDDSLKGGLLHEIQHAIQEKEGFAKGGTEKSGISSHLSQMEVARANKALNILSKDKNYLKLLSNFDNGKITFTEFNNHPLNKKYESLIKQQMTTPRDIYTRYAGEVESRNVQNRMNLTPEQRRLSNPISTEDIPRDKQIVSFKGGQANLEGGKKLIQGTKKLLQSESKFVKLIRGEGKNTTSNVDLYGEGLYLTDPHETSIAKHYGDVIKEFNVEDKIYDSNKEFTSDEIKKLTSAIDEITGGKAGKQYLQDIINYNDGKLPKNTGEDYSTMVQALASNYDLYQLMKSKGWLKNEFNPDANFATLINKGLNKMGYKGVKYNSDKIEELADKGLGGKNVYNIFDINAAKEILKEQPKTIEGTKKLLKGDDLIEEAKKYKSAEEFIKSKEKVYHGGNIEDLTDFTSSFHGRQTGQYDPLSNLGINLGDKGTAEYFSKRGGGKITEAIIYTKRPLKTTYNKILNDISKYAEEELNSHFKNVRNLKTTAQKNEYFIDNQLDPRVVEMYKEDLLKKGYDTIIYENTLDGGIGYIPLKEGVLKTESQLKDIYNKAHSKPLKK